MKKLLFVFLCFSHITDIYGQEHRFISIDDINLSPTFIADAMISRTTADSVLSVIGYQTFPMLLFSADNNNFLIIYKKESKYLLHRINLVQGYTKNESVKINRKTRKLLDKAFVLKNYHTGFITSFENMAPQIYSSRIVPIYFVIVYNKKRYGEFYMSALNYPPIDLGLYGYLLQNVW